MRGVLTFLFFVAASSAADVYEIQLLGNHLEDLITEALEYVRTLLQKHDPFVLPAVPEHKIANTDIDVTFSAKELQLSNISDFTIDKIKVNPIRMTSQFQVTIPTIQGKGNYKISGTILGKKVDGLGAYQFDITNFTQRGDVHLGIKDHSLQVKDLTLDYSIGDFKINVEGLTIEGLTQEQINDILNHQLLDILNNNKAMVEEQVAANVKIGLNSLLHGHSLADVISWLEKIVASTPDPPPFTIDM